MTRWLPFLLCLAVNAQAATPIFIADLNGRYGSTDYHHRVDRMIEAIIALEPEAVVIAGDMVAGQANPALPPSHIKAMWRAFDETVYQPLNRAGIPVLPVPGNHDASIYKAFSEERSAYASYWRERPPAGLTPDSLFPWYYAKPLESGRFVGLDVTAPTLLGPEQSNFLLSQRRAAVAAGEPLMVATHLPLHPVAIGRESEVFQSSLAPLPGETWVAGHHHAYYAGLTPGGGVQLSLPPMGGNRRAWIGGQAKGPFGFAGLSNGGEPLLYGWPDLKVVRGNIGPRSIRELRRLPQAER